MKTSKAFMKTKSYFKYRTIDQLIKKIINRIDHENNEINLWDFKSRTKKGTLFFTYKGKK